MKITVMKSYKSDVEIEFIQINIPVRDEEIEDGFPLRTNNYWSGIVELSTGRIIDWPKDKMGDYQLFVKVCDMGKYMLMDRNHTYIGNDTPNDGYVPNEIIPGKYGDYVSLEITDGIVTNWPKNFERGSFDGFFKE